MIDDGARWIPDPTNPEQIDDLVGGFNSVLTQDCQGAGPGACGDVAAFDWRDAVMYFILVDRFFDSDGRVDPVPNVSDGDAATGPSGQYEGGDLAGVTAKVPYLRDLGVTALWLSAPYENRNVAGAAIDPGSDPHTYSGYHGYWPSPGNIDFTDPDNPRPAPAVESRIGTADDLHGVVDSAHGSGIKVLFDYVMGHADAESGLVANHMDWFVRDNGRIRLCGPENLWDDPVWGVLCAFTEYLPKFDFRRADVRAWSVSDALWWAKTFGIDGYRLDAIKHQPLDWLRDLRARLNAEIAAPDGGRFYLVGETFAYDDQDLIRRFVDPATMLDGQFDFPFKARLCEALFTGGGRLDTFSGWIAGNDAFYGPGSIMTTWIGNHDIPRAIHFASGEIGSCREGSHAGNGWTQNYRQPGDAAAYERLGPGLHRDVHQPRHPADLLRRRDRPRRRRRSGQSPHDALERRAALRTATRAAQPGHAARPHPRREQGARARSPHPALRRSGHLGLPHERLRRRLPGRDGGHQPLGRRPYGEPARRGRRLHRSVEPRGRPRRRRQRRGARPGCLDSPLALAPMNSLKVIHLTPVTLKISLFAPGVALLLSACASDPSVQIEALPDARVVDARTNGGDVYVDPDLGPVADARTVDAQPVPPDAGDPGPGCPARRRGGRRARCAGAGRRPATPRRPGRTW